MVILTCGNNGLIALICDKALRVYDIEQSKLVHKFLFSGDSKTGSSQNEDDSNTTFSHGCAFSNSGQFLAAFSESKDLFVWHTQKDWKQVGKRKLPKRPTAVLFTNKEDCVVISDKAGDVYSCSISEDTGLSCETLLLGHVSMILDMTISKDDKYIITADRDEKIRVTCFPNTYNIETFCLGHKEYVWKVLILETRPDILVSASGDGTVQFWNFMTGESIHVETFKDTSSNLLDPVVSCLGCSKQSNFVFIGLEGLSLLYTFIVTRENQVKKLPSSNIVLDAPPCSVTTDHNDQLWVVQSYPDQPVVIYEMKVTGNIYMRKNSANISQLLCTEGWNLIYDNLKKMPCLENLKKKEGYGTCEYYNRKKDRIEAKRKKDAYSQDNNCIDTKKVKT